jgi:ribosomal protein L11 methyltransferase
VALLDRFSKFDPTLHEEEEYDWVRHAQDQWQPFAVGERFYLVPEWRGDPAPEGRLRLTMHPGMACGTGTHPATRLCLIAMEKHIHFGDVVLDVGTGSGILADGARLLGAHPVFGCDIEHEATQVAQANLGTEVGFFTGSARSVRDQIVDWAVCNLNAATLKVVAPELWRATRRGLILSGFREEETPEVAKRFDMSVTDELELEGYACLVLSR